MINCSDHYLGATKIEKKKEMKRRDGKMLRLHPKAKWVQFCFTPPDVGKMLKVPLAHDLHTKVMRDLHTACVNFENKHKWCGTICECLHM